VPTGINDAGQIVGWDYGSLIGFTTVGIVITNFSQFSATDGTFVTITGASFGDITGTVTFRSVTNPSITAEAFVWVWNDTEIEVAVPSLPAGSYTVTVTPSAGSSSHPISFTIPAPDISQLSPVAGPVGTPVTITGSNFGTSGTVKFDAMPVTPVGPWSNTRIVVQVPNLPAGSHNVTVTTSAGESIPRPFQVTDIELASVRVNPPTVVGGVIGSPTGTVTLTGPASSSTNVMLSTDVVWPTCRPPLPCDGPPKPLVVAVDTSVPVPANQSSATFPVSTNPVLFPHLTEITASYNDVDDTAELTLIPPPIPPLGPEANARVRAIIN
jgi:hypothetical protein